MPSIHGWGGVYIHSVEIPNAIGRLSYEQEIVRNKTIGKTYIEHFQGWRPIIEVQLFIMDSTDISRLITVISLINQSKNENTSLNIYPRYTSTDSGSLLYYPCFLDGNFAPEDIANVNVGQTLTLRWVGERVITDLPGNYSGQTTGNMIDESSNKYIDELGNYYTIL